MLTLAYEERGVKYWRKVAYIILAWPIIVKSSGVRRDIYQLELVHWKLSLFLELITTRERMKYFGNSIMSIYLEG